MHTLHDGVRRWSVVAALIVTAAWAAGCQESQQTQYTAETMPGIRVRHFEPAPDGGGGLVGPWRSYGPWTTSHDDYSRDYLHLDLQIVADGSRNSIGYGVAWSDIKGLDRAAASGPLKFECSRDAGTLLFEGQAQGTLAEGMATFTPDATFMDEVARLTGERPTAYVALVMMVRNVRLAWFRELKEIGYLPPLADIIGMTDIDTAYVRALVDGGYTPSVSDLRHLHFLKVPPEYVLSLRRAGYDFSAREVGSLHMHRVSADAAAAYREAGYDFSSDELKKLNLHRVDPAQAAALRRAGYQFTVADLQTLTLHRVSADYAVTLREAGYDLSVHDLTRLSLHRVPAEYAAAARWAGHRFSVDELARLTLHRVPQGFVTALPGGENGFSADDMIRLHMRGLTAEEVRKLSGKV